MSQLFDSLKIRSVLLRNRIGVSPMCQYSSQNGMATDWHLVHLGAFARGGAALVMMEATAVSPEGRISAEDNGIWSDAHLPMLKRIVEFIDGQGAVAGIQLAHAGRKASRTRPWEGDADLSDDRGGWEVCGPSPVAFAEGYRKPKEMSAQAIRSAVDNFVAATVRAQKAGFRWVEIHAAHGYLIHNFLSPLSNQRTDAYGGSFQNRTRFLKEITEAVRKIWPAEFPLSVRLSCSDYVEGGWTIEDSMRLSGELKTMGVDLIDCSSGGNVKAKIPVGPGYQVPFAEAIRKGTGILTAAVGMITEPAQANEVITSGRADVVLLARQMLRDPQWPFVAAKALGQLERVRVPAQYLRAIN